MTSLIDGFVSHLGDPSADIRSQLNVATELRDSIETNQVSSEQENFVTQLLPEITRLLDQTTVSMIAASPEHKLRHCLLDGLARLQPSAALKPVASELIELVMRIIQVDNEDNGIVCMKIFTNLVRTDKEQMNEYVQPFMELVVQIIGNMPQMVHDLFDAPKDEQDSWNDANAAAAAAAAAVTPQTGNAVANAKTGKAKGKNAGSSAQPNGDDGAPDTTKPTHTTLFPATKSFKVLAECPIIIVMLSTSFMEATTKALPTMMPHIIEGLTLEAAPQAREHASAAARGTYFAGVAPALRMSPYRPAYNDFVLSQIKLISFMAYVVRTNCADIQTHLSLIPNFVVRLLKDCPPESSAARRELLVSMRHFLSSEHHTLFLSKVHMLLEERVVIGYGLTAREFLRANAFTTIADFIHHVREELSAAQVIQVVKVYSNSLIDNTMTSQFHAVCIRLLLNILERTMTLHNPEQTRQILMMILRAAIYRLEMLNKNETEAAQAYRRREQIIKVHSTVPYSDLKEMKVTYRSIIMLLRSVFYGFRTSNAPNRNNSPSAAPGTEVKTLTYDGVQLLKTLLREGLQGLKLFKDDKESLLKDLIEPFVAIFFQLDIATFNEVFVQEMPYLVELIIENPDYLHFTYVLTHHESTSAPFCTILLDYLVKRLPDLGEKDGAILLRLFKQCFAAVNTYPNLNEPVVLPHLRDIIVKSLDLANDTTEPQRFFALLQHLFRILGGGRFDHVYQTIVPLLHFLLETLNKRLAVARVEDEKNIYADLCLIVPVRLSLMVPHLNFLMRPLAQALNAKNPELITQGLRTLELFVDNLTASFLDPLLLPVLPEVLPALWRQLKPAPYDHKLSHITLRILGKMGGRSRAHIMPPSDLKHLAPLEQDVAALVSMDADTSVPVRVTPPIKVALRVLGSPLAAFAPGYRKQAYKIVSSVLLKCFPAEHETLDANIVQSSVHGATVMVEDVGKAPELPEAPSDKQQRQLETEFVEQLVRGLFLSCADPEIRDEAEELINQLCEHIVLLELGDFNLERRRAYRPFNVKEFEGPLYVVPRSFVAGIAYGMSHWLPGVSAAATKAIKKILEIGKELTSGDVEAQRRPLFRGMYGKLCHCCFEEAWYTKRGAIKGLSVILHETQLPKAWLGARVVDLARTLFFVMKDTSPTGRYAASNVPSEVPREAAELLMYTLSQLEYKPTDRHFLSLTGLLSFELESACGFCRETSQRAIKYLSEKTDLSMNEILSKVTGMFLTPIFMKPMRALPFPMQIGYSDCISFCLSLPDTFIKFNDKLIRLLEEALAIVDANDESLISAGRPIEYTTAQQLTEVRTVCIRLLAKALTASDELSTQCPSLKNRILSVLFNTFANGSAASVVDAAEESIGAIMKVNSKLPKELIQSSLKPILHPLSDYKRLEPSKFDSLERLLGIMTLSFRIEIGTKILEHLRTFSEPARLVDLPTKVIESDPRVVLGVAIIRVFHKLPANAHIFIPDLVATIVAIENTLRRTQTSPFRPPLARFVDRYPAESFAFFAGKLNDATFGMLFVDMIRRCPKLAKHTQENIEELNGRILTQSNEAEQCVSICNLVFVVSVVDVPRKVVVNLVNSVNDVVRTAGGHPQNSVLQSLVPHALDELQRVVIKLLSKVPARSDEKKDEKNEIDEGSKQEGDDKSEEKKPDDGQHEDDKMDVEDNDIGVTEPKILDFDLIHATVCAIASANIPFLPEFGEFFWNDVVSTEDILIKQSWLSQCIPCIVNHELLPVAKQFLMEITNLVLMVYAEKHESLETLADNSTWLQQVHELIWQNADKLMPHEGTIGNPVGSGLGTATLDRFFLQLLQMSVLLVEYCAPKIIDMRKNVIKFGWRYLTVEDVVSKLSAYVLVDYFVKQFDTLSKIVVQIYFALLKTQQAEARSLVQQALDVLATVIVQRVNSPLWARAPRRVLSDDGHGIAGISSVCLFLARHAKLFYPYRELYVQFIVSAMVRLSNMASQTLDVDLAELLAAWESQRQEEFKDSNKDSNKGQQTDGYDMPHPTREAVITYIVRFITAATRVRDPSSAQRIMAALDKLLDLWPDTEVRLNFFDRPLAQTDFAASPQALNASLDALKVVDLALRHKSDEWITANIEEIAQLLEKPLQCSKSLVHDALKPILRRVLAADSEDGTILRLVVSAVVEHLSPATTTAGAANQSSSSSFSGPRIVWVQLALEAVHAKPNCLDEHMGLIIKALSRMAKDRMENNQTSGTSSEMLVDALKLVAARVSSLGDQRRTFLTFIAHVVDRVHDKQVALFILDMVNDWMFGNEPFPTMKEKAAILHKLLAYKDPVLSAKYFDIIIRIFEDPLLRATELPSRLEQPFLAGCTSSNVDVRTKLMTILSDSVGRTIGKRLVYVLCDQNWEPIADQLWLCQALQLLLTPLKPSDQPLKINISVGFAPVSLLQYADRNANMEIDPPQAVCDFVDRRKKFLDRVANVEASDFLNAVRSLLYLEPDLVQDLWLDVFPAVYHSQGFAEKERLELVKGLVTMLAQEYHMRQADCRPNVVQILLAGLAGAGEQVPPQLTKYLATNYDAWYTAIQICENIMTMPRSDSLKVAEVNEDALAELYAALGEEDHFYGLWRTRSKFSVTSAALSYEQCGMWGKAMQLHESAQIRARCGALPFGESEYGLWEDHWILCAEKLQHWEILTDIAKHEGFTDLLLECQWRLSDWTSERETLSSTIKTVMDVPTPRRKVFETFLSLQGFAHKADITLQHLGQHCDEGIQLSLRKWHSLPARFTPAHAPLLHTFQQFVEFMEATQVYTSLQATTSLNIESKSQELKGVMQAWHERLPNVWDDINWWGDLAAWRQHVFGVINRVYLPLLPTQGANGNGSSGNSAAYRGYHEIAWTINRFAHTARKQNLLEVCTTQLSKIYTLPNIEIQEAFLKLREQAKCHLQNPNELATGLDVISNTNLAFFGNNQKAEFFALKAESLAKLGQDDHAFNVLSAAVQIDLHLPKAWAAWGELSDRRFTERTEDTTAGASAITCYLHAISQYKNRKSRKLIGRLLWLLGLSDPTGALGEAFEEYKGDTPTWYYVTYIPQLLTSLSQHESKYTSKILIKIAKAHPQALQFYLKTAHEEYSILRRQQLHAEFLRKNQAANADQKQAPSDKKDDKKESNDGNDEKGEAKMDDKKKDGNEKQEDRKDEPKKKDESTKESDEKKDDTDESKKDDAKKDEESGTPSSGTGTAPVASKLPKKQPWEYVDEIMAVLKTAYPLLSLSLETLVDQVNHRFKSPPDEDAYRLVIALLNDGLSFGDRKQCTREDEKLPASTESSIMRFTEGVIPEPLRPQFEADFVNPSPTLDLYIRRLRSWRNRLEEKLDARPYRYNLEALSPPLAEFHYQKFEEVEIPGQSMELCDDNQHFHKIGRFVPHVDVVRGYGIYCRRLTIQATDGSFHTFAVQNPSARYCRREERLSQVFKILDSIMQRRTEARRRNLKFTLPNAVAFNMHLRMVQDDPNYVSFYEIYEKFCRKRGQSRDAPFDYTVEQLRAAIDPNLPKPDTNSIKVEIMAGIQAKLVPQTIMRDFFTSQYTSYEDFWLFRKQFAYQYALVSFMTIMMSVNGRYPQKFLVNLSSGNVWATEMLPIVAFMNRPPNYLNGEPVAIRLTPNIQTLMGQHVMEGVFAPTLMIIAKSLTDPEFDVRHFLPLFVRDDIISWFGNHMNPEHCMPKGLNAHTLHEVVISNADVITKRASFLAQPSQSNSVANQTALDIISLAVNPKSLATTEMLWMPYY